MSCLKTVPVTIPEVTAILGGDAALVPVEVPAWAKALQCFWNVREAVSKFGGEAVYGWQIHTLGDLYYQCEHHAVWRRPDGVLIDITPNEDEGNPYSLFIQKEDLPFEGWQVPTRRIPISEDLKVRTFCAVSDTSDRLRVSVQREPYFGLGKIYYDLYRLTDIDRATYWACEKKREELRSYVFPTVGGEA